MGETVVTIDSQIREKVRKQAERRKRKDTKNQLSRNGYAKYTSIETDMVTSCAFQSLNATCIKILLLFLLKRRWRFKKRKTPVCLNCDDISMTYIELTNEPFNYHPDMVRRSLKALLCKGFIKIMHQGGAFKKDKTIYAICENWRIWKDGMNFNPQKKDVKRGFQGRGLGAVSKFTTRK